MATEAHGKTRKKVKAGFILAMLVLSGDLRESDIFKIKLFISILESNKGDSGTRSASLPCFALISSASGRSFQAPASRVIDSGQLSATFVLLRFDIFLILLLYELHSCLSTTSVKQAPAG